jgi:Protein of unknown function (DUF4239)
VIRAWLNLPVVAVFLVLAAYLAAATIVIHWLTFGRATRPLVQSLAGVVAPYAGSLAVLFALLTGFLANDVWERERRASRAVLAERDGLLEVHGLSVVSDMAGVRDVLVTYLRTVVADEWPRLADQERSAAADEALGVLLREVARPDAGGEAGPAVRGALLNGLLRARSARDDRLVLSHDQSDATKWMSVLILALLTKVALAVVHLDRPRAQLAALVIFGVAAATTLGLVAMRERPFAGPVRVSPAPLEEVLSIVAAEGVRSGAPIAPPARISNERR